MQRGRFPDYYHIWAFIIRLGESEDCAGAVSFMCSDDARYMTGETIVVSGGMQCRL